jgi:hypothetical protein
LVFPNISYGSYPLTIQLLDVVAQSAGEERIKMFEHAERYVYEQTDIAEQAIFEASIKRALEKVPKGSLFGAVHCAAVNPNCPWPVKMSDKIKVSRKPIVFPNYSMELKKGFRDLPASERSWYIHSRRDRCRCHQFAIPGLQGRFPPPC